MEKEKYERDIKELLNIIHGKDEEIEKLRKQNEKLIDMLIKISQVLHDGGKII